MGYSAKLAQRARTTGELSGKHQIYIDYQYKDKRTKFNVENVYAAPSEWNPKTQLITSGNNRETLKELNGKINALRTRLGEILNRAALIGIDPSHDWVKREMEKPVQENNKLNQDVPELFEKWVTEKGVKKYVDTIPQVREFAQKRGGLKVGEVDKTLLSEFCTFLCKNGYIPYQKQKKELTPIDSKKQENKTKGTKKINKPKRELFKNATIVSHVKYFKLFFKEFLTGNKYPIDQDFRDFRIPFKSPKPDVIALTKEEFDRLFYFKVPKDRPAIHLTKITFIIGTALGGLRISDLKKLNKKNFSDGGVKFRQIKTGGKVENPLSDAYVEPFLEEFLNNKSHIPSGQKFNDNLKVLAKLAGLNRAEVVEEFRGGSNKPFESEININEYISSKLMRKTFISIMVELGVEREVIMAFSGHEDVNVISHYIQVHKKTKIETIQKFKPDPKFNPDISLSNNPIPPNKEENIIKKPTNQL